MIAAQNHRSVVVMNKSLRTDLYRLLRRFGRERKANVAVIFALAAMPIIGCVGAAIDYSHANSVKTALQAALDSTALMLAKDASSLSTDELDVKALDYFTALFNRPEGTNITIKASYTTDAGAKVLVNGAADVPTTFMDVLGLDKITVAGSSTAKWGSTRLRVALVLDNTGSMAWDGKMTALKAATKDLVSQLQSAATTNGDVYLSIIPFSKDVNVGSSNYNSNWIDWTDWDDNNGSDTDVTTCTVTSKGKNGKTKKKCSKSKTWVAANHDTWNGCITDRDKDYDQDVTPPNPADAGLPPGKASTLYPADQYENCPVPMMGLSYDWSAINSLVDAMKPSGSTNQPIGLVWGWLSLVGGGPLTAPPKDSNYTYQDVIVLMSDGLNTEDRWYTQQTPVDNRMFQTGSGAGTCANIKNAGVTIYTVQVNTGSDPTSTLLQNCAGTPDKFIDPSKFYMVTSANGLASVFSAIGTNLTKLRVAK